MRTRIVLCLLLNLAVGSADAQATVPVEGQRGATATERAHDSDSDPPPRAIGDRVTEEWLIRGEVPEIVAPTVASTSRRPLSTAHAEDRRPPGWIIQASPSKTIP
jgi:hypothetical protein